MTTTETIPTELAPREAHAIEQAGTGIVVDVREPWEWETGHAAGAAHIPLNSLPERHAELPRDRAVLVICASGNRSMTAARYLSSVGFDARSVAGGTAAWAAQRLPIEAGATPTP